ncbi:class I SAM-dependent methyltransferase [Brachybacterium sp. Marseille-Q7125]|uniref:class I SAM-dependent methyltransferase n=1 Tax=Brachybacterium sp. Marseille-Q7125 TaxID=2932815 RepID=UPI001FF240AC|nr:class I SAM-dependent methyltransferase [Brachybacterium sp. Marseille-Q7125]
MTLQSVDIEERARYWMSVLGDDYLRSHFSTDQPLAVQQLTHNRYRTNPRTLVDHTLACLDLDGTEAVLDVGCGNGFVLRDVASRMRYPGSIMAIDQSSEILDVARSNVNFAWVPVKYVHGDARRLDDLIEQKYDRVMANFLFHYIDDPDQMVSQLRRATADDGMTVVTVEGLDSMPEMYQLHEQAMHAVGIPDSVIERAPKGRRGTLSPHNGQAILEQEFSSVSVHPYEDWLRFNDARPFMEFYARGHRYAGLEKVAGGAVDEELFSALFDDVQQRVEEIIDRQGFFRLSKVNVVFVGRP